jgi:hypothetical protein
MVLVFSIHSMNEIEPSPNQKLPIMNRVFYQDTWIWDIWQVNVPSWNILKRSFQLLNLATLKWSMK